MEKQYSCKTASEHYSYSEDYFRKLVYEKQVPFHKIGRQVRFNQSDLDKHFKSKMM